MCVYYHHQGKSKQMATGGKRRYKRKNTRRRAVSRYSVRTQLTDDMFAVCVCDLASLEVRNIGSHYEHEGEGKDAAESGEIKSSSS